MTSSALSKEALEVALTAPSGGRLSRAALEAAVRGGSASRLSREVLEAAAQGPSARRDSRLAVEVAWSAKVTGVFDNFASWLDGEDPYEALFADDFNRPDGALTSPWVQWGGTTSVVGNAAKITTSGTAPFLGGGWFVGVLADVGWSNVRVEIDILRNSTVSRSGLMLATTDNDNGLFWYYDSTSSSTFYKMTNGTIVSLGTATMTAFTNVSTHITLTYDGMHLTVSQDGVLRGTSAVVSGFTGTKVGFGGGQNQNPDTWDNIKVYAA